MIPLGVETKKRGYKMAKFDIKSLIDKNTNDGTVDYTKVNEELETQNRNIVVKESKKEIERLSSEAVTNVIKELKIDGETIDDVKKYIETVSGSTDDAKKEALRVVKEFNALKVDYDKEVEARTGLETAANEKHQTELIKSIGITDEKQIEYFKWDFNKQVTEDNTFDDVVKTYVKENDIKTDTKIVKDQFGPRGTSDMDIGAAFAARREHTRKK